jgi:hypothetical protein
MEQKMDQNKTDQILELLAKMNANQAEAKRERDADKAEAKRERDADKAEAKREREADKAERKAHHEEMMTSLKRMNAKMDAWLGKTEACREVTHACLEEEREPTPIETEVVVDQQEVPNGATEDRTGELRLVLRRHRQRKKRAQVNGGSARGRLTRRAVPAMRKGHVRRGPGKRCHRNGVRKPGRTSSTKIVKRDRQPAVGYRSPLRRRTKVTVVQGAPEGRTDDKQRRMHPECNSGIRRLSRTSGKRREGRTEKRDQHLEPKMVHHEVIRRSLHLEIAELMFESSVGLREPGDELLWKCRPPPKQKR